MAIDMKEELKNQIKLRRSGAAGGCTVAMSAILMILDIFKLPTALKM